MTRDATRWVRRRTGRPGRWRGPGPRGLAQTAIRRIGRAFGLKRHLVETYKLVTDPPIIEKVRDVVGPSLHPTEAALVLSVDEKAGVQALDRTAPHRPLLPGVPRRRPRRRPPRHHRSVAAFDVAPGTVVCQLTARHRAVEIRRCSAQLGGAVRAGPAPARGLDSPPASRCLGASSRCSWPAAASSARSPRSTAPPAEPGRAQACPISPRAAPRQPSRRLRRLRGRCSASGRRPGRLRVPVVLARSPTWRSSRSPPAAIAARLRS